MERIIIHELSEEYDELELYPLSDLHIGDQAADLKLFERFIQHILEQPNRYIVAVGDLVNNAIKTSVSNVYNETIPPREQKKYLKEKLSLLKGRILALVQGNHEYRNEKDVDNNITYDLADSLGLVDVYRDNEAVLKITFGKKMNGKRNCYTVYCTHGTGGGKRPGSAVNNIELLALSIDADVYIIGHVHKRAAYKNTFRRIDTKNNVIITSERLFVITSSFVDFGGYAARKMLIPSAKGSVPIILYGREKKMEAVV